MLQGVFRLHHNGTVFEATKHISIKIHFTHTMQHARLLLLMLSSGLAWSCKNDSKTPASKPEQTVFDQYKPTRDTLELPNVSVNGAHQYDIIEGTLFWSGNIGADKLYNAQIKVSGGQLLVDNGFIVQGKMLFDLKGLSLTDNLTEPEKQNAEKMLRSAGYFNTAAYPTMEYTIEGALPSSTPAFNTVLEGSLKIKDKAGVLNIPATLSCKDNQCQLETVTFDLGYGQWGLMMPGDKHTGGTSASSAPPGSDAIRLVLKCTAQKR